MTKLFRRIVIAMDDQGHSFFETDDRLPVTFAMEDQFPGYNNIETWEIQNVPPTYDESFQREGEYDFNIAPGRVRFFIMRLPPVDALLAHQKKIGNEVDPQTFGMHRTDTIDCLTLLSGGNTLILDSGEEKTLESGDSVVMQCAPHAWQNCGKEACYEMCTMIGGYN